MRRSSRPLRGQILTGQPQKSPISCGKSCKTIGREETKSDLLAKTMALVGIYM